MWFSSPVSNYTVKLIVFIDLGLQVSGDATLQVDHFTFSPSIADNMRTTSLVISHAGVL
jgi:UDP-N-acetylglucosamine transferase subunit ALG13